MTIQTTIDRLQQINSTVSEMVHCPLLEDYPESLDALQLPVALTMLESGQFQGMNGDNHSEDQYVIRVLFDPLGASDLGFKMAYGAEIYDAYRSKYLDPETFQAQNPDGTYQASGMMVLQYAPYRIEIQQTFRTTGLTVFEYPVNADLWWHGFEIRFGVTEAWEYDCS